MMKKLLSLLLIATILVSMAACGNSAASKGAGSGSADAAQSSTDEVTEYTFLLCWNGGAAAYPDGFSDSAIMKELEAKTGVRLKVETIAISEREKLATLFASGDVPDIVNAPFWNIEPGTEGNLIYNAAQEGLLLPITQYIDKYPNIARMYEEGVVYSEYLKNCVEAPAYNGEIYTIPMQTPRTEEDTMNFAYNTFVRQDILKALNIDPSSINTPEALYDLLKKIKAGDFKDTNGKPVIPAGAWHNGSDVETMLKGFWDGGCSDWTVGEDGKIVSTMMTPLIEEKILFMRKLVEEGLIDPECFTQTDTLAKEKMITGRIGVFSCGYLQQSTFLKNTLYTSNPEMEYIPVGPMLDQTGTPTGQYERYGRNGTPVLFFSKDVKNPEKLMNFINYINSDEGLRLVTFGIEGVHYEMDGDIPVLKEEWEKIKAEDTTTFYKEGFGMSGNFIGADPRIGWGWDRTYTEPAYVKARETSPLYFVKYKSCDDLQDAWQRENPQYGEKMATVNWDDEQKKAFLAKSDEEALNILNSYRERMNDAGFQDMTDYLNEEVAKDPKIVS